MKIAICDDERWYCKKLCREVEEIFLEWKEPVELYVYFDGESLEEAHQKYLFTIILLDVDLGKENGFEVAKSIQSVTKYCKIIFLSNHEEWVQDAFKVHAYRYLYKSRDYKAELEEAIRSACEELREDRRILVAKKDKKICKVQLKQIIYVESLGDEICIHLNNVKETKDDYVITGMSMKQLEGLLDDRFFRCHYQYIINYQYMKDYKKDCIIMDNLNVIPLARARRKKFLKKYQEYLLNEE